MAGCTWVATRHVVLPHWVLHSPLRTEIHVFSLGLQVHNSCLASSCLHWVCWHTEQKPIQLKQKEICRRSLVYTSQAQKVRLTLFNASDLFSHSPYSDSSTLNMFPPLCWAHIAWASLPSASDGAGSRSLSRLPCWLGSMSMSDSGIFDSMIDPDLSGLHPL